IGAAVAPAITKGLDIVTKITAAIAHWVDKNRALTITIGAIGAGFGDAGTGVTGLGLSIAAVGVAISAIGSVAGAIGAAVTAVGAPVLAIAAAVTGAVVGIGAAVLYVAHNAGLLAPAFAYFREAIGAIGAVFGQ